MLTIVAFSGSRRPSASNVLQSMDASSKTNRVAALLANVRTRQLGRSGLSASLSLPGSSVDRLAAAPTSSSYVPSPSAFVGRQRALAGSAETTAGRVRLSWKGHSGAGRGIAKWRRRPLTVRPTSTLLCC